MNVNTALSLGIILLAGLGAARFIRKLGIPAVTSYLLVGILIGPCLHLVSEGLLRSSGLISNIALSFIAFSLGQNFLLERLRRIGRAVLSISIGGALGPWLFVTLAIWFLTEQSFAVALVFGSIAAATAPAATVMVIKEYRAKGRFTDTLLGVVAIDDAWGIILFVLSLAIAKGIVGVQGLWTNFVLSAGAHALIEILGALVLGAILGWLLCRLSHFAGGPSELLIYTLGFILLNTGAAFHLGLSVLLANISLGAIVVNIDKTGFRFFDAVRNIDSPLYVLFFVLAGANLEIGLLKSAGLVGLVYVLARIAGKFSGAFAGAQIAGAEERMKKYIGLALIPQAGVALGLALIAKLTFPEVGPAIFSTIVATTVIYELIGPLCTKFALKKAGEI